MTKTLLLVGWRQNFERTETLIESVPAQRMTTQPNGMANHPAWTLAHLIHYHPAILSVVRAEAVSDPGQHPDAPRYDAGSTPIDDPTEYPSKRALMADYRGGHDLVAEALTSMSVAQLQQPPRLARWASHFGDSAELLTYLMIYHEATHLGQIMAWRRLMGWPPIE